MILKDFGLKLQQIDFSEKSHRYKYRPKDLFMRGTTTVIKMKKKPWMGGWAAKEVVKALGYYDKYYKNERIDKEQEKRLKKRLKAKLEEIKELTPAKFYNLLKDSKGARYAKSDGALDTGRYSHKLVQHSIEKGIRYKRENIKYEDKRCEYEIRNCYEAWLNWEKEHEIEYLGTEVIVAIPELLLAGTIDIIAIVDGKFYIGDWKTSKYISSDVFLQTAAYKYLLENNLKKEIKDINRFVLRLDKGINGNNEKIKDFKPEFEYLPIESDYEKDLKCFKGLFEAYKWDKYQKSKNFLDRKFYNKGRK